MAGDRGVSVLVSGATRALAGDAFGWDAAEPTSVKGRAEMVATYVPNDGSTQTLRGAASSALASTPENAAGEP